MIVQLTLTLEVFITLITHIAIMFCHVTQQLCFDVCLVIAFFALKDYLIMPSGIV